MDKLLGIDLGTTGCKSVVCTAAGEILDESYLEYPLITLSPTMIEQEVEAWWAITVQAVCQAVERADLDGQEIRALSVSSQGISFVLLDERGEPLGNSLNWLDTRATREAAEILNVYPAEELFALTGKRASAMYVLPKLLWLRRHQPDRFRRARVFLMGHDYLLYKLCGQYVTDHSMACGTLLYDLPRLRWSEEMLSAFDVPVEKLPRIEWAGTSLGPIRPEAARELGLDQSTAVVVGGQDQKCAALGAGIRPELATVSLGTATAITVLADHPPIDRAMRIPASAFVVPQCWELEGVIATAGGSLRWYRETFAPAQSYAALDAEAERSPPGANGVFFYPHLSGVASPRWQDTARGIFQGISLSTNRGDMTRSVLEGVAFQIRENVEAAEDISGPVEELILFGGGARSALWRAIIGDVCGKPVTLAETVETACLGACILAGVGGGLFADWESARQTLSREQLRREPDPASVSVYEPLYRAYVRAEDALLP